MKRFIVGDIHGAYKALIQVLKRADFNPEVDTLYAVGDYVDGWPESSKVVSYLKNIPHFKGVLGNHDSWAADWLRGGSSPWIWLSQGGTATVDSYNSFSDKQRKEHGDFLYNLPFSLVEDDIFICHGGVIYPNFLSEVNNIAGFSLMWDRELYFCFAQAYKFNSEVSVAPFKKVFIGHTQTSRELPDFTPFQYKGLWNIDQGAGWNGKLTVVNIDTDEWWQSDFVADLYPNENGRMRRR